MLMVRHTVPSVDIESSLSDATLCPCYAYDSTTLDRTPRASALMFCCRAVCSTKSTKSPTFQVDALLFMQGLKVLDDSVENLALNAMAAFGSAWKGSVNIVHKLEQQAEALAESENVKSGLKVSVCENVCGLIFIHDSNMTMFQPM